MPTELACAHCGQLKSQHIAVPKCPGRGTTYCPLFAPDSPPQPGSFAHALDSIVDLKSQLQAAQAERDDLAGHLREIMSLCRKAERERDALREALQVVEGRLIAGYSKPQCYRCQRPIDSHATFCEVGLALRASTPSEDG